MFMAYQLHHLLGGICDHYNAIAEDECRQRTVYAWILN